MRWICDVDWARWAFGIEFGRRLGQLEVVIGLGPFVIGVETR